MLGQMLVFVLAENLAALLAGFDRLQMRNKIEEMNGDRPGRRLSLTASECLTGTIKRPGLQG
jgi:hypothetical protein